LLSTKQKISIARLLFMTVMAARKPLGLSANTTVKRRGIIWSLNLKEGIDLSIYLMGGFELRAIKRYSRLIRQGDVVLDIGANIGAHTLPLAGIVGAKGKVIAFEPSSYAFNKLQANIALNPILASRIDARQAMLMRSESDKLASDVYSSWPLELTADLHEKHLGRLMPTKGAIVCSLDQIIRDAGLNKIDFIKLDVDGNEWEVMMGGLKTIMQFKPTIMMELAPYVYSKKRKKFDEMLTTLYRLDYAIFDIANGKPLPRDLSRLKRFIPRSGAINVWAKSI
jgi:FkbM family methyltransferase